MSPADRSAAVLTAAWHGALARARARIRRAAAPTVRQVARVLRAARCSAGLDDVRAAAALLCLPLADDPR